MGQYTGLCGLHVLKWQCCTSQHIGFETSYKHQWCLPDLIKAKYKIRWLRRTFAMFVAPPYPPVSFVGLVTPVQPASLQPNYVFKTISNRLVSMRSSSLIPIVLPLLSLQRDPRNTYHFTNSVRTFKKCWRTNTKLGMGAVMAFLFG